MTIEVRRVSGERDELGESPYWNPTSGELVRVDTFGGKVHILKFENLAQRTISVGAPVGFVVPSVTGMVTTGVGTNLLEFDDDGICGAVGSVPAANGDIRINDGKCDPSGRLWFGTISKSKKREAGLYRVGRDGRIDQMLSDVRNSNGLCWDASRALFYYVDTWDRRIDVFDYDADTGDISNRRVFVDLALYVGLPDGMTVDADGRVWVAMPYGSQVLCFDVAGDLCETIEMPVTCPTSVAFGGPDLGTLFITSSRHHERIANPLAGALLSCTPGVHGQPVALLPGPHAR